MHKFNYLAVVLFASTLAGAQSVTVGSLSSVQNGTTTTITVPVSVAVPPATTTVAPVLASLVVNATNTGGILNAGAAFTTIPMNNVVTDSASGWNWTTNSYAIPVTGTYLIVSHLRLADGVRPGISYGQGVNSTNVDNPDFLWTTTNGMRNVIMNTRIVQLTAGTAVRLFGYVDSTTPVSVIGASLSIQQIY
ncbi:MAG: hypothetical protein BGO25_07810 [Acidobacteriales bacterium 59-55]|nr:hypothetical protein [Terriglobales bacterium]OJV43257.1 MAG: hypothetical protein BGO25_07810 [Acidobacteriales bacterium 59-55]